MDKLYGNEELLRSTTASYKEEKEELEWTHLHSEDGLLTSVFEIRVKGENKKGRRILLKLLADIKCWMPYVNAVAWNRREWRRWWRLGSATRQNTL